MLENDKHILSSLYIHCTCFCSAAGVSPPPPPTLGRQPVRFRDCPHQRLCSRSHHGRWWVYKAKTTFLLTVLPSLQMTCVHLFYFLIRSMFLVETSNRNDLCLQRQQQYFLFNKDWKNVAVACSEKCYCENDHDRFHNNIHDIFFSIKFFFSFFFFYTKNQLHSRETNACGECMFLAPPTLSCSELTWTANNCCCFFRHCPIWEETEVIQRHNQHNYVLHC